ncbi:MAG: signal peptide peptidase SppA [Pseudomonadota bacterium]
MSQKGAGRAVWRVVKGATKGFVWFVRVAQAVVGLVFLFIFLSVIAGMASSSGGVKVPERAALVIAPRGVLVEQAQESDPVTALTQQAFGGGEDGEVELRDIVDAIGRAAKDERIAAIVLQLQELIISDSDASKTYAIADAVDAAREAGKPVVAMGDAYNQSQYLIAAHADEVLLNPMGGIVLTGYGRYGSYFRSMLEKLDVTVNVFKVGEFKSAVEPFTRDSMSEAAKTANIAYLSALWSAYVQDVETARRLPAGALDRYVDEADAVLRAAGGDPAETALRAGLVDKLSTRPEQLARLIELVGEDAELQSFAQIDMGAYLAATRPAAKSGAAVGVVTAAGAIMDGEQPSGTVGGDTVARLLRQARNDSDVKAVVLRVDSPGGSAFASEIIRQEILELKKAGKPVVASMGSLAASGGYWISASADEIWARDTTITGSIGVFGLLPTFEGSLENIGVTNDGVGTSELAGLSLARPLSPIARSIFQQSVEDTYGDFLKIVSEGRDMPIERVDQVAQGRVWIGSTAQNLGLVDEIGDLDDAVAAAARRADLASYEVKDITRPLTPFEEFLLQLVETSQAAAPSLFAAERDGAPSLLQRLTRRLAEDLEWAQRFNDPNGAYALCVACGGAGG